MSEIRTEQIQAKFDFLREHKLDKSEFIQSLREQFEENDSLSGKQHECLTRAVNDYKEAKQLLASTKDCNFKKSVSGFFAKRGFITNKQKEALKNLQ